MSADNPVSLLRVALLLLGLLGLPVLSLLFGVYGFVLAIVFLLMAVVAK